jgi:hypothetical protein
MIQGSSFTAQYDSSSLLLGSEPWHSQSRYILQHLMSAHLILFIIREAVEYLELERLPQSFPTQ